MPGKAFIFFEFQSGVLICHNSVISCNELNTQLFTACRNTFHDTDGIEFNAIQTYKVTQVQAVPVVSNFNL